MIIMRPDVAFVNAPQIEYFRKPFINRPAGDYSAQKFIFSGSLRIWISQKSRVIWLFAATNNLFLYLFAGE